MKQFYKRALAYLIDCVLCYSVVMLLIQWLLISNIRESIGMTDSWFEQSWNLQSYVWITISIPVWLYFTYFDSVRSKGTYGKRVMGLTVLDNNNQRIGLWKSFQRAILKLLPWELSHVGIIFPTPMYFEEEPSVRVLSIVAITLLIAYTLSIILNSDNRSLYDNLLRTKVIKEGSLV